MQIQPQDAKQIMEVYREILGLQTAINKEVDRDKILTIEQMMGINAGLITSVALFAARTDLDKILIETIDKFKEIIAKSKAGNN